MFESTKKEFDVLSFEELIEYCTMTFDEFYKDEELKKCAEAAIEAAIDENSYNLAIHLLETLKDNPADYYYYDEGMGIMMKPQPITCKEDLLNTGYIRFNDDENSTKIKDWKLEITSDQCKLIILGN